MANVPVVPSRRSALLRALPWALALAACGSDPRGTLALSTGEETEVFSRQPAPETLVVDAVDVETGERTSLVRAPLPAERIDLGERDALSVVRVHVDAIDAEGRVLITGRSMPMQFGALGLATIFVQRTGEFARMPGPVGDGREAPAVAGVIGRFVFVSGGEGAPGGAAQTQLYDLGALSRLERPPALPVAPKTVASYGTRQLLIHDEGATWFELSDSSVEVAQAPDGGAFAEVSGGAVIVTPDATTYVVGGARRAGGASARVLRVARDGALAFLSLTHARLGAAATWVEGRGLIVAGGSADTAGAELLAAGATRASALPFAPDATIGGAAAPLDGSRVLLVGGVDEAGAAAIPRVLDLGCASACAPIAWERAAPPIALVHAEAFDLGAAETFLMGDDADGLSHAFRVREDTALPVPFKTPRRGARAVRVNPPAIAVVGGADGIESFTP